MTTLATNAPIGALAHILRAARLLGPSGWESDGGGQGNNPSAEEPELSRDLLRLFVTLRDRQIPFLLVGGVALLRYIEGRNTEDVDLLLSLESLQRIPEIALSDRNPHFARGNYGSVRVDLLLTANPLFGLVHDRYRTIHRFREIDVPCATVEGLLILKLYALPSLYRQGDGQRIALYEADITMLMQRYRPSMQAILQTLEPFVDARPFAEWKQIVRDIEQRIARIDRGGSGP